jgi:F-type H+-transporting ATPase subunit a
VHSPIEQFVIHTIIPIHLFGYDISFTNSSLFMVIATVLIIGFQKVSLARASIVPKRLQSFYEMHHDFVVSMIRENSGEEALKFFPLIFTLFMFVFVGNLLGMIPYSFTFTSHIAVTLSLAFFVFIFVTILGFVRHGWHFFRFFLPEGIPIIIAPLLVVIELISYLMRPFTLAIRLFANMMAGHILLKLFGAFTVMFGVVGILPFALNVCFTGFEIFIAALQAYVFSVLTCIYLNDALHLH